MPYLQENGGAAVITSRCFQAVVVGCSAGGLDALRRLLAPLPADFPLPIVIVAHMAPDSGGMLVELLDRTCRLAVIQAEEKMAVVPGHAYICPAGYHLLVEEDRTLSLSVDDRVCNVRPSIDVLFESAADAWGEGLIGIVLTGANSDGTAGLLAVKAAGGYCLVEDPALAYAETMPRSAIEAGAADCVQALDAMPDLLMSLTMERTTKEMNR